MKNKLLEQLRSEINDEDKKQVDEWSKNHMKIKCDNTKCQAPSTVKSGDNNLCLLCGWSSEKHVKKIEIKTTKMFLDEEALKLFPETWTGCISEAITNAMEAYAQQERQQAVHLALQLASEKGKAFIGVNDEPLVAKGSILSIEAEILDKLK